METSTATPGLQEHLIDASIEGRLQKVIVITIVGSERMKTTLDKQDKPIYLAVTEFITDIFAQI